MRFVRPLLDVGKLIVLLVEDDARVRRMMARVPTARGITVIEAADVTEGLAKPFTPNELLATVLGGEPGATVIALP